MQARRRRRRRSPTTLRITPTISTTACARRLFAIDDLREVAILAMSFAELRRRYPRLDISRRIS